MSDEAAFLRAIQANPADHTAKLVYADWLDERGESERAEYLRLTERLRVSKQRDATGYRRLYELEQRNPVWVGLVRARVPIWDEITMFLLGRLQGLLAGYALLNGHESDIGYEFRAALYPRAGTLAETAAAHFGKDHSPVTLEPLPDWEASLRDIAGVWLFHELRHLVDAPLHRLAFLSDRGRQGAIANAVAHVRTVIAPTAGWRVQIPAFGDFYAIDWADVALESADRVLFLHFSLN